MEQHLSLYRIFYTVANTGNISQAAKQLYNSQPAISKSISRLEESLGVTLFSRSSRGVTGDRWKEKSSTSMSGLLLRPLTPGRNRFGE